MATFHRKLFDVDFCYGTDCISPPPPPPPPPPIYSKHPRSSVSPLLLLLFCALATTFFIIFYLTLSKRHRSFLRNSLRRNRSNTAATHEEFVDEDRGPEIHHPIWLINYVGLEQSVIDSIDIVKFKKGEGIVEGVDCSVCLTEFEDDENLRLLPKCNHAFHVPCIDTWLRSHKNCPLCRAPVVRDSINARVNAGEVNLNGLSSSEETPLENFNEDHDHDNDYDHDQVGENGDREEMRGEIDRIGDILEKNSHYINGRRCGIRVLSDLGDHRGVIEELQPVRRSISMDVSSASRIYSAFANIPILDNNIGSSDADDQLVQTAKPNSEKTASGGPGGHKRSSSSMYMMRVMKSSSFGLSAQKGLVSMKRSYSTSGKYSQSSHGRSHDSILPL